MKIKFTNSEYVLNESQINRFELFKELRKTVDIDDTIELTMFEKEFDLLLNSEVKYNITNVESVEEYFSIISYFGHTELIKDLYNKIYEHEYELLRIKIEEFFIQNHSLVNWSYVNLNPNLTDIFYEKCIPDKCLHILKCCKFITSDFIEKNIDKIDWFTHISKDLSRLDDVRYPRETKYYIGKTLYLGHFYCHAKLSLNFIEKYKDKIDIEFLCANPYLGLDFWQDRYKDINWYFLSWNTSIPESFYHGHESKLNWDMISRHPKISLDFYRKNIDFINWDILVINPNVPREFYTEYKDLANWDLLKTLDGYNDIINRLHEIDNDYNWSYNYPSVSQDYITEKLNKYKYCTAWERNHSLSPEFIEFRKNQIYLNTFGCRYLTENDFTMYKLKTMLNTKKYTFDSAWKQLIKIPDIDYGCFLGSI